MKNFGTVNGVEVMDLYNADKSRGQMVDVKVINICDLLENLFPGYFDGKVRPGFDETGEAVIEWCKKNDAHFYARCREDFFMWEGVDEASSAGKTVVVVEDMS